MSDDVADVIAKLQEIEQQAFIAFLELPKDSIAYARLRHITILVKYARLKLAGIEVRALEDMPRDGTEKPSTRN